MLVNVVANLKLASDVASRQWYAREMEALEASGVQASLTPRLRLWPVSDAYVSWWVARSAPAVLWARLTGGKCIVVAGGTDSVRNPRGLEGHPLFYDSKPFWVRLLTRFALRFAHAVVAVSHATVKDLKVLGARHVVVIPNSIDVDTFRPAKGPRPPVIVTVCNMEREACELKGLPTLLRAFALVHKVHPGCTLRVIGSHASGYGAMLDLVRQLEIEDSVDFCGPVPNNRMAEHYTDASMFVSATRYETFGVAIAEAMSCGLPVVASRLPAIQEVVGDAAVLVEGHNPASYAQAMLSILEDKSVAHRLARTGRDRILTQFHPDKRAKQMTALLSSVLGKPLHAPACEENCHG